MAFVQFVANSASVVPASAEVTYDKFWMKNMRVNAPSPDRPARLVVVLVPARDVGDTKELMPNAQIEIVVEDVFAYAANNASFAATLNDVFSRISEIGIEQGVIASS